MTKNRITEVRDDLDRLIEALQPGSVRFAVAQAVEKLDAILRSPDEPKACVTRLDGNSCPTCGAQKSSDDSWRLTSSEIERGLVVADLASNAYPAGRRERYTERGWDRWQSGQRTSGE